MNSIFRKLILFGGLALMVMQPGICTADSMSGVGDLSITTLDSAAQKILAANGVLGANQTDYAKIVECSDKAADASDKLRKGMATAMTPSDPTKKLNNSVNACLANIQQISLAFNLPSGISFTLLFQTILKQLMEKLVDEFIMKICAAATGAWNSAIGNAINTINSGVSQSGIDTFGNFVNAVPVPVSPSPFAPAPANPPSGIPGL